MRLAGAYLLIAFQLFIASFLSVKGHQYVSQKLMNSRPSEGFRRVIVKHRHDADLSQFSFRDNFKVQLVLEDSSMGISVIIANEEEVSAIAQRSDVEFVEEDSYVEFLSEEISWGTLKVHSNFLWNKGFNGTGSTVCILDSGIRLSHEDLDQSKISGPTGNDWSSDDCGHGTQIAGVISAQRGNGKGNAGVAPGANLHVVKVTEEGFGCHLFFTSQLILAVTKCEQSNSKIILLSMGTRDSSKSAEILFESLREKGFLVISAAGNRGDSSYEYPASYPSVLSVGAIQQENNSIATFSQFNGQVDLVAPGVKILTFSSSFDTGYTYVSGTSIAAAHVAGVAALLWSAFPESSNEQVRKSLELSALDLGDVGRDDHYGYGLVNAYAALDVLRFLVTGTNSSSNNEGAPESPTSLPLMIYDVQVLPSSNPLEVHISWKTNIESLSAVCFNSAPHVFEDCEDSNGPPTKNHNMTIRRPVGSYLFQCKSSTPSSIAFSRNQLASFYAPRIIVTKVYVRRLYRPRGMRIHWVSSMPSSGKVCFETENTLVIKCLHDDDEHSTYHQVSLRSSKSGLFRFRVYTASFTSVLYTYRL